MRALVAACTAGLVMSTAAVGPAHAQPASQLAQAKQLYDDATAEMAAAKYDDAARDFAAAYDITQDPVLFFKIGAANEKAGKCDVAVEYYRRYLAEAKPEAQYVELTNERMAACTASGSAAGSATATGSAAESGSATPVETGSATPAETGSATPAETGSGSATETGSAAETGSASGSVFGRIRRQDTPWLLVGGAIAFVTVGAVLAYSASSSESDIRDLYAGVDNQPVTYDATTAQRYHDLVNEGHRYEYLSWASFGIAAAFGVAAAVYFVHDYNEQRFVVVPTATPQGAGVAATVRF
jgi:tetratricopeptide (TPR) repeat protein